MSIEARTKVKENLAEDSHVGRQYLACHALQGLGEGLAGHLSE
jgi:hypothetical protein